MNGERSHSRIIVNPSKNVSRELSEYVSTKDFRRHFICNFFDKKAADCVAMCDKCIVKYKKK